MRTQEDRDFDLQSGREIERKDAEIAALRSTLASLLVLAEAESSPLTLGQIATICRFVLDKQSPLPAFNVGDRVIHMNGKTGKVAEIKVDGTVCVTFDGSGKDYWKGEYDANWFRINPSGLRPAHAPAAAPDRSEQQHPQPKP